MARRGKTGSTDGSAFFDAAQEPKPTRRRKKDKGAPDDPVDVPNEWSKAKSGTASGMGRGRASVAAPPPQPSYIGPIACVVLCCIPLAVISIAYAVQVPGRWRRGDEDGARHAAERSEFWMYASVGAGVIQWVVGIAIWYFSLRGTTRYG